MFRCVLIRLSGFSFAALLALAVATVPPASAELAATTERAAISRLYLAAFDRPADAAGLDYWHHKFGDGIELDTIAGYFVRSAEFQATYGNVDNEALVTLIYRNVLRRPPDSDGLEYWVALLDGGHSAGTVLNGFAQSPEFADNRLPKEPDSVLMIGDSIFHGINLLGIPVGSAQLTFMTEEGRQADSLPGLLDGASRNGSLDQADVVVIHLGSNGWNPDYVAMFNARLEALAPKRVLIVNTEVARPWEDDANGALGRIAEANPNVVLVDWHRAVAAHPDWLRPDGVHPTSEGLRGLADLIEMKIRTAY